MATNKHTSPLDTLLRKEMTRKEFLGTLFGLVVGVMGLSSILGLFTGNTPSAASKNPGYGKQGYGP